MWPNYSNSEPKILGTMSALQDRRIEDNVLTERWWIFLLTIDEASVDDERKDSGTYALKVTNS
jgi:hypothetical protein